MKQYLQFVSLLGSLSKDVFEQRMSIGTEGFSIFTCLDANKFVMLSLFPLVKKIYPRVSTKPNDTKSPLPVNFRRSKTLWLKLLSSRQDEVPLLQFKPEKLIFHYSNFPGSLMMLWAFDIGQEPYSFKLLTNLYDQNSLETLLVGPR